MRIHKFILFAALLPLAFACTSQEQLIFESTDAVNGHPVGLMVGTTHVDYLADDYPESEQRAYDNLTDLIQALKVGSVEAAAIEGMAWKAMHKEHPDLGVLWDYWKTEPFGMIFNKSNTDLLKRYNEFIAEMKESGLLQEIEDKWIDDVEAAQMPDLSDVPRSGEPLKVGCTGTAYFYDFIRDGKNAGLDMEIVERFAAYLGRPIEFNIMNFGGMIAAVSSEVVDMATSAMCITEERAKQVNFGDSYASGYSVILARKENLPKAEAGGYMTLDDLAAARVGLLLGSTQDQWMNENHPDIEPLVFNNTVDVVNALINDQCDAIVIDDASTIVVDENPDLAILDEGFCPVTFSVCFPKDSPLMAEFNEFQRKLSGTGELAELFDKWTDNSRKDEHKAVVFEKFEGKPLRFGTTLTQPPYSYFVDGSPAGFDVELLSLFGREIGRSIEVIGYDFGGLITGLTSGSLDVAANSIMYTKERGEQVAFAIPYREIKSIAVVKGSSLSVEHKNHKDFVAKKPGFFEGLKISFYDNLIKEKRWMLIVDGLMNTVLISIFSILFGTVLAAGICAMRMSRSGIVNGIAMGYISLIRGIPVLVLLMILFYVVFAPLGVSALVVSIITFSLNFAAYGSEMFRSGLQSIDPGQRRAGIANGFTELQTFRYIIFPQAVKRVLPVFKGEAISLVKTTSIVGYIAVADLTKASDIIRSRTFDAFFPLIVITVIYFILAWLLGKGLDLIGRSSGK